MTQRTALGLAMTLLTLLLVPAGCSTHNTTLVRRGPGDGQVIYRLSEEQVFTVVVDAFAEVLPSQSLYDITGVRRGYQSTWRMGLDTYSQKVLIVPAVGTDASGHEVKGFWFDVSGSGTAGISGGAKNRALFRRLQEALEATGTATVVTNLRDGRYETDGRAYRAEGRDAREAAPRARATSGSAGTADKLRELKTMHESGLITDQEYEAKRRQLLDRM
jgi:hypothetical protein